MPYLGDRSPGFFVEPLEVSGFRFRPQLAIDPTRPALRSRRLAESPTAHARIEATQRRLTDCGARRLKYRAALDAVRIRWWCSGGCPRSRESASGPSVKSPSPSHPGATRKGQVRELVRQLGEISAILAGADPKLKAQVHEELGINVTYDPNQRVACFESHPTNAVGNCKCRRGDLNSHALSGTSPSSWRVCLFRHSDGRTPEIRRPKMLAHRSRNPFHLRSKRIGARPSEPESDY